MRGRRTLLIGSIIASAAGCADVLAPADFIGEYALTRVDGDPLPALSFENTSVSSVVVADTLRIRSDGTGSLSSVMIYTDINPLVATAPRRVAGTTELFYRVAKNRLEITMYCPPNANCVAGPHIVAVRTPSGLSVTYSLGQRVPQEFSTIGAR